MPREILTWYDLTKKEREDFDYLSDPESDFRGFRYYKKVYYLGEFLTTRKTPWNPHGWSYPISEWDGIESGAYGYPLVVRLTEDNESVIVGVYDARKE